MFCSWYVCIINTFYCNLVNVTSSDSDLKITIFFSSSSFCPLSTFSCVCICHVYYVVEHERKTEKIYSFIFHANFPIVISNKIKLTNTCTVLQKKFIYFDRFNHALKKICWYKILLFLFLVIINMFNCTLFMQYWKQSGHKNNKMEMIGK